MKKIHDLLLLICTFLVYSISLLLSRTASLQTSRESFLLFYGLSLMAMALYAVLWQLALQKTQLNTAYSMKAITMIFAVIFGFLFFKEAITVRTVIALAIIFSGVYLVGKGIRCS